MAAMNLQEAGANAAAFVAVSARITAEINFIVFVGDVLQINNKYETVA